MASCSDCDHVIVCCLHEELMMVIEDRGVIVGHEDLVRDGIEEAVASQCVYWR